MKQNIVYHNEFMQQLFKLLMDNDWQHAPSIWQKLYSYLHATRQYIIVTLYRNNLKIPYKIAIKTILYAEN